MNVGVLTPANAGIPDPTDPVVQARIAAYWLKQPLGLLRNMHVRFFTLLMHPRTDYQRSQRPMVSLNLELIDQAIGQKMPPLDSAAHA